jgi:hypothetical protein
MSSVRLRVIWIRKDAPKNHHRVDTALCLLRVALLDTVNHRIAFA